MSTQGAVEATDASPAMLELGQAAAPTAVCKLREGFGPQPKAKAIASSGLLHWSADPGLVLKHWRDALPKSGRLLLGVPCDPCLCELRDLTGEGPIRWRDESSGCRFWTMPALTSGRMASSSRRKPIPRPSTSCVPCTAAASRVPLGSARANSATSSATTTDFIARATPSSPRGLGSWWMRA